MNNLDIFLERDELKNFEDNWSLVKYISGIIDTSEAREYIIHILDIWESVNKDSKPIWIDLIERTGFYPYFVDKIKDNNQNFEISLQAQIRLAYFKSDVLPGVYFHEKQKEIEKYLSMGENIAVSAPTSFGKSLLIEEMVARKKFDNILIIQPTLALIDETRKKMRHYQDYYDVIVNTRQDVKERNIFILTAERVLEFPELPRINFFIIDEFYKISSRRNDSRIDALNIALFKVMNMNPQAMFLTPSVDSLSEKFREKYDVTFFKTDYALVNTHIQEIRRRNGNLLSGNNKKNKLFQVLSELIEPTIVYVKSPGEAYKLAKEYMDFISSNGEVNKHLEIYDWIDQNISPNWQLKKMLKYGIGAHNGSLPRHLVTSEIDLFNKGFINVLFATASLIEGVNTAAKNMVIYSQNKGSNRIDYFDFANIRGRAGRMKQYFTGQVYLFIEEPVKENFTIDVPIVDQEDVSDEVLINIPDDSVEDTERKKNLIDEIPIDLINILKKNMINVAGQKALFKHIRNNRGNMDYLKWNDIPSYEQLRKTLLLGYAYIHNNDNERFANFQAVTALKLVNNSLKQVILDQTNYYKDNGKKDPENRAIDEVLKFQRRCASFEIPKLLAVVESIQKYVFESHNSNFGSYSMFAAMLENDQVDEKFQFLVDYGIPASAIKKISRQLSNTDDNANVIKLILEQKIELKRILLPYEFNLLRSAIFSLN